MRHICTIASDTSVHQVFVERPVRASVNRWEQVIVAEVVRVAVLFDRIKTESRTIVQRIARGRRHCIPTRAASHTVRPVEDLVRCTPVQGRIQVRRVAGHLQLADVEDVVVARPCRLLAHVIAAILIDRADGVAQLQRALARLRIVGTAAPAFDVYRSETVAALLAEMVFLAVVRIRKDAHRRTNKVLLVANAVARSCKRRGESVISLIM